jgi:DNA-binding GntR family transcriptional regulator
MARDKPERLAASAGEHRTIAEALAARDGDLAAHATHVHLHNALTGILETLPEHVSSRSARSTTERVS